MFNVNCGYTIPQLAPEPKASAKKMAKPGANAVHPKPAPKAVKKPVAKPAAPKAVPAKIAPKTEPTKLKPEPKVKCKIALPDGLERPLIKADKLPTTDLNYVFTYAGSSYRMFNERLAAKGKLTATQEAMHKAMHRASSRIEKATTLYRGLKVPANQMPNEWIEERWASSSIKPQTAESFASGNCWMQLHVAPEVRVIATCHILGRKDSSYCENEQEITIAPGAHYKVIKRDGHKLTVEVTPGQQAERKQAVLYKKAKAA